MNGESSNDETVDVDSLDLLVPVYGGVKSLAIGDGKIMEGDMLLSKFPNASRVYGFIRVRSEELDIVSRKIRGNLWLRVEEGRMNGALDLTFTLFLVRILLYPASRTYLHVQDSVLDWNPTAARLTVIWSTALPLQWENLFLLVPVHSLDLRAPTESLQRALPILKNLEIREIAIVTESSTIGLLPFLSQLPSVQILRGVPRDQKDQSYEQVIGYTQDIVSTLGSTSFPAILELRSLLVPPRSLPDLRCLFPNVHSIDIAFERPGDRPNITPLDPSSLTKDEEDILKRFQTQYQGLAFNLFLAPSKTSIRSPRRLTSNRRLSFSPDTKTS